MIIECMIASNIYSVEIDGHRLLPDLIDCTLPIPLLREHSGQPVGEVYRLDRNCNHLIAVAETSDPTAYTHVSPGLRLIDGRMKLFEVSLVRDPKSKHTQIRKRYPTDPHREYQRSLTKHHDLLIECFTTLQRMIPLLQETNP